MYAYYRQNILFFSPLIAERRPVVGGSSTFPTLSGELLKVAHLPGGAVSGLAPKGEELWDLLAT